MKKIVITTFGKNKAKKRNFELNFDKKHIEIVKNIENYLTNELFRMIATDVVERIEIKKVVDTK